jgi:isocitrate dehydrogenase
MVEALIGALEHAAHLDSPSAEKQMKTFTSTLRKAMHNTFRYGQGTRDMSGPEGLTTEQFVAKVNFFLFFKFS